LSDIKTVQVGPNSMGTQLHAIGAIQTFGPGLWHFYTWLWIKEVLRTRRYPSRFQAFIPKPLTPRHAGFYGSVQVASDLGHVGIWTIACCVN